MLSELCTVLGVPLPNPSVADDDENACVFEKRVETRIRVKAASSRFSEKGKRQAAASTGLTLTAKEKTIHEQGLVSILKQLHDDLDAAVADTYGWESDLPEEEILTRLVALNHERAEEEKRGLTRWLRPEYQARGQKSEDRGQQQEIEGVAAAGKPSTKNKEPRTGMAFPIS